MFQSTPNTLSGVRYHLDEQSLIRQLYLLGQIQQWMDGISRDIMGLFSYPQIDELNKGNIYLTALGLCNILTEHYHKVQKQNRVPRFTIPVADIVIFLKEASAEPVSALSGTQYFQTLINTGKMIGYDRNDFPTCFFTIITEANGRIVTAFPGFCMKEEDLFK